MSGEDTGSENVCVIFCMGFNSNRQGNKAIALENMCRNRGLEYVRFDYRGHGESGGQFATANISQWLVDTLAVIDQVPESKKIILVGSSMGGWLALLAALNRPSVIKGLMLIACAADMTRYYSERLHGLELELDLEAGLQAEPESELNSKLKEGRAPLEYYSVPNSYDDQQPYRIYKQLIDDGEQHFLLHQDIALNIPVRLVHGMNDDVVPWQRSQQVLEKLQSNSAMMTLIKAGDHRLSEPQDLQVIEQQLDALLKDI